MEGKRCMNEDNRRSGTNLLIIGITLFLIGLFDNHISDLIQEFNDDVRIYGWGWIPQLIGGLLAIYGFMILLEEYLATSKQPYPGVPQPTPLPLLLFMDKEIKKVIWLLMIVALVIYILSPGLQCQTVVIILLVLAIIFLIFRGEQRPYYPYPPPYYPPRHQMPYKVRSAKPPPSPKGGRVKICKRCNTLLELDWVACPICGEPTLDKR
ncbi:MAG: hypothetical protein JSW00_08730 [Thermoplasmata archaeon]|nr:MAG: hypothetical protein JSW00_08730 [Thermoplasmata archaeon]